MNTDTTIKKLTELIEASHSPFHCCTYCVDTLKANGFKELFLSKPFQLTPGEKYVMNVYGSTCIAFTIGKDVKKDSVPKLRMITSHTDWPSFVIKPSADIKTESYVRLNTEPYGGAVYHTWIDRPLGIAGRICTKGDSPFSPNVHLFDSNAAVATIPGLAVHMDREINNGLKLNPQTQLLPLFSINQAEDLDFSEYLAKEIGCEKEDLLDYELFIYNAENAAPIGRKNELYSSPRIDNCSGVLAGLEAILNADNSDDSICISAFYHNEEIGNETKQGADSELTEQLLNRIFDALSMNREVMYCACADGLCLSLDVAHALHPAYTEKNDPTNKVLLGSGVCLKLSARQSYSTDSVYISMISALCEDQNIPYAKFVNRSDMRGGSTLGTVTSAAINIPCVDAGVPLLSMHSARELIAADDQCALCNLAIALFS